MESHNDGKSVSYAGKNPMMNDGSSHPYSLLAKASLMFLTTHEKR
jgi:hypothetical protein